METQASGQSWSGRRPTMGDVALRVGVSRQLVGIVFRNDRGVSSEMRARILQAAEEIGYQPDVAAQSLRQGKNRYLGVVFTPSHTSEVDIVDQLYPAAAAQGYRLVLSALGPSRNPATAVDEVLGYRCAALLIIGSVLDDGDLRRLARKLPVVVIGTGGAHDNGCDYVHSAGDVGMLLTVDHLYSLGHRDIAYLYGSGMPSADLRFEGYRTAMEQRGLPIRAITVPDDYTEESGAASARQLLADDVLPTAVMASNDHAAVGFIHTALAAGMRVPADLSVTGFDDSRVARLSYVQLTTVHQDGQQIAHAAVAAAVSKVAGRQEPANQVINPTLVIRSSTARPRRQRRRPAVSRSA